MRYQAVVFDFDGTVARTEQGITRSVAYALARLGEPVPDEAALKKYIGPPLHPSFMEYAGLSPERAEQAVTYYRERYGSIGLYEAELYPGFADMVRALRAAGASVSVASGKPEAFLRRVIQHLGVEPLFDAIAGPDPSSHSTDKSREILRALPQGCPPQNACMVGDRCFDVDSGKRLGMATVGVLYGYGAREELEASGADFIAESVEALRGYLLG